MKQLRNRYTWFSNAGVGRLGRLLLNDLLFLKTGLQQHTTISFGPFKFPHTNGVQSCPFVIACLAFHMACCSAK